MFNCNAMTNKNELQELRSASQTKLTNFYVDDALRSFVMLRANAIGVDVQNKGTFASIIRAVLLDFACGNSTVSAEDINNEYIKTNTKGRQSKL